jgi:hypothetical protein
MTKATQSAFVGRSLSAHIGRVGIVTVGLELFGARSDAMTIDQRAQPADILSRIGSSPSFHGRRERAARLLRYRAGSPVRHRRDLGAAGGAR